MRRVSLSFVFHAIAAPVEISARMSPARAKNIGVIEANEIREPFLGLPHGAPRTQDLVLIVTNSSAAVGWIPIVASNWALVAPQLSAIASP
jgi:hypothetical protein